ncbi:unnamed protein product, partial [Amoebophrya sp. A25]|eukprot:GSA25T00019194001.1
MINNSELERVLVERAEVLGEAEAQLDEIAVTLPEVENKNLELHKEIQLRLGTEGELRKKLLGLGIDVDTDMTEIENGAPAPIGWVDAAADPSSTTSPKTLCKASTGANPDQIPETGKKEEHDQSEDPRSDPQGPHSHHQEVSTASCLDAKGPAQHAFNSATTPTTASPCSIGSPASPAPCNPEEIRSSTEKPPPLHLTPVVTSPGVSSSLDAN